MRDIDFANYKKLDIKDIRKIEVELLVEFADFCEKNGLKYLLDAGTLLGAIRHNGFIPWDDDIDVVMPYPDYVKFIKLFESQKHPNRRLSYGMKNKIGLPYAKLMDSTTIVVQPGRDRNHRCSVWIDIFPAFSLSDDDREAHEQISKGYSLTEETWDYINCANIASNIYEKILVKLTYDKKLARIIDNIESIGKMYPYGSTKRVRDLVFVDKKLRGFSPELFDDYTYHMFEENSFRIPKDYNALLTAYYGDTYMMLPPESERIIHPMEVYKLLE